MDRKEVLTSLAVLLGILLVIGLIVGAFLVGRYALPACQDCVDAEAEYYRGIYDTCLGMVSVTGIMVDCLGMAGNAAKADFYETPSPGWQWPLEPEPSQP